MDIFGRRFPKRTFDVGIAEQHAVTFAAAMAAEGLKPFCSIYSTFMQRGYDQVVHDVVIQKLPVRMILDRAGLVGNDGPTHHGTFDLAYMGCLPDLVIMAPSDEVELMNMVRTAHGIDDLPSVLRYPRGTGYGLETLNNLFGYNLEAMPEEGVTLEIGKGRVVRKGRSGITNRKQRVALLSIGTRLSKSLEAANNIEAQHEDLCVTVADARFMKPLDHDLIRSLVLEHGVLITVEEGSIGGFGDHVIHFLTDDGALDKGDLKVRSMVIPDRFIEAGAQSEQYEDAGLNTHHIEEKILGLVGLAQTAESSDVTKEEVYQEA